MDWGLLDAAISGDAEEITRLASHDPSLLSPVGNNSAG